MKDKEKLVTEAMKDYAVSYDPKALESTLEKAFSQLTPREQSVINMRLGLEGQSFCTFKKIGQYYNISEVRARMIYRTALRKIRTFWKKSGMIKFI